MKCAVCGAESGKYPLCRNCYARSQRGELIKCPRCHRWHGVNQPCPVSPENAFLYEPKSQLMTPVEAEFWEVLKRVTPQGYFIFPQINLATFIDKTDGSRFHNELFRNVDFLITDCHFHPRVVIEINDQSHLTQDRRERDEKVHNICQEAGIPIVTFWTSYGANPDYIGRKVHEALFSPPPPRVHHKKPAGKTPASEHQGSPIFSQPAAQEKKGCYIATCIYGSYDCPEVWVLRRFRDCFLSKTRTGRLLIRLYYAVSPVLVRLFGRCRWFHRLFMGPLQRLVAHLMKKGYSNSPYSD